MTILTKKQAIKAKYPVFYQSGDYAYYKNGYAHFIRNGINILSGLNAVFYTIKENGDITYKTENNCTGELLA